MEKQKEDDINEVDFEEVKTESIELSKDKQLDALKSFATLLAEILIPSLSRNVFGFYIPFGFGSKERRKSIEEKKLELVKSLVGSGIDVKIFDTLITNEINRRLKIKFGIIFLIFTFLVTVAAYSIVILNAVQNWGISDIAITALIIELPIQFIGLLYIIAKNLFPGFKEKQ